MDTYDTQLLRRHHTTGVAMIITAFMLPRFFAQTHTFSVSLSSFCLSFVMNIIVIIIRGNKLERFSPKCDFQAFFQYPSVSIGGRTFRTLNPKP